MTAVNQINVSTPFLIGVPNSQVSREWIRLLNAIVTAVGSPNSIVADDFQTEVYTSRITPNEISNLMRRIDDLEARIPKRQSLPALLLPEESLAVLPSRSASTAMAAMVSDDTATNATMYPVFANGVGSNRPLSGSSSKWTYNPSTGRVTSTQLMATAGFGCNGATPQAAVASGGAAPAGGVGTAAGGYDTAAHRDTMITLVNNIRSALVANGIMS